METQQKKQFKDLFKDKYFLYSIPIFLILVGVFIWFVSSQNEKPDAPVEASRINTSIPLAKADSVNANKLDLQASSLTEDANQTSAFQGVPGGTERYLYNNSRYRPSYSQVRGLDSVYQPSQNRASAIPVTISPSRRQSNKYNSGLQEEDITLHDEPNESAAQQAQRLAGQRAEINNLVEKQKKLESLLTEYKRDKKAAQDNANDKTKVFKVLNQDGKTPMPVTSLGAVGGGSRNSFYGLYTEDAKKAQQRLLDAEVGTIRAAIYGDQPITPTSSRIKLRLLEPLYVRGIIIPVNSILYGMGSFQGQRVGITIKSIQYQNRLFPVNIGVYDMDGMSGLYVPNMAAQDISRQASGQAIQSFNPGFGGGVYLNGSAQAVAASAALQAGQQIYNGVRQKVAQKVQTPRAFLKNNYYVLLRQAEKDSDSKPVTENAAENPFGEAAGTRMQELQQLQQILQQTQKNQ